MKRRVYGKCIKSALLVLSGLGLCAAGGASSPFAQAVTLDAYLDSVRTTHPFFRKERVKTEIERLARDRWLGTQDWRVSATPFAAYQRPLQSGAFTPEEVATVSLGAEAQRTFWNHGGRLSVAWESTVSDQDIPGFTVPGPDGPIDIPIGPSTFYENRLSATYSYPLLQNRGGGLDRLDYELAGFSVALADVQALENQEKFLLDVGASFVDWALFIEQARIVEARLEFAQQQLDQTRKRRDANLVDEVDVLRAQDSVQGAKENLLFTESRARAQQAGLAVLAQDEDMYASTPEFDLYRMESLPGADDAIARLDDQRLVRTLRIRRDQLLRQKEGFEDLSKPQLFLSVRGALQEGDAGFWGGFTLDKPDVAVLLDFTYPLGNRTARADMRRADTEVRQIDEEIESLRLNLEAELRKLWIEIRQLEEVLVLNRETIRTARQKTAEEVRLYNQGRNEITFVIQSRDSEALGEYTYAVNAATYHKLVLRYREILDDLLPAR